MQQNLTARFSVLLQPLCTSLSKQLDCHWPRRRVKTHHSATLPNWALRFTETGLSQPRLQACDDAQPRTGVRSAGRARFSRSLSPPAVRLPPLQLPPPITTDSSIHRHCPPSPAHLWPPTAPAGRPHHRRGKAAPFVTGVSRRWWAAVSAVWGVAARGRGGETGRAL